MLLSVKFSLLASLIASAASAPAEIVIHNQITVAEEQVYALSGLLDALARSAGDSSAPRCAPVGRSCNFFNEPCCPGAFCVP